MKEIRVLLADDHALIRGGIRALLEKTPELQIVAEASDGPEALRLIEQHQPDVALIESTISKLNGFEVTARVSKECPKVHVIILSTHANEECLRQTMDCGAAGYLTMTASAGELKLAIETVANGKTHISSSATDLLVPTFLGRSFGKSVCSVIRRRAGRCFGVAGVKLYPLRRLTTANKARRESRGRVC